MVYDKIKYVFRKDGRSGKELLDNWLKLYKDDPDNPALVNATSRRNITINSINDSGSYLRYRDAHNDDLGLNMEYCNHTAVIMEDGIIFYDLGDCGENKDEMHCGYFEFATVAAFEEERINIIVIKSKAVDYFLSAINYLTNDKIFAYKRQEMRRELIRMLT